MLAFSEGEILHTVRGCRKLHPRLLNSVAFSDKTDIGGQQVYNFIVWGLDISFPQQQNVYPDDILGYWIKFRPK